MKPNLKIGGTPLDKLLLGLSLVVLAILIGLYLSYNGASADVTTLRRQVDNAGKDLQTLSNHPDAAALQAEVTRLKLQVQQFPSASEAMDAMSTLWKSARDSGVLLEQLGYSTSAIRVGDWTYAAYNFPLSGKGTSSAVADFTGRIQNSPLKTVGVSQLQIAQGADGSWQFSLVFTVWTQGSKVK